METLTTGGVEDIERSVMAYRRMEEVSWSRVHQHVPDTTGAYLYYDWDNGEVMPVPRSGSRLRIPVLYRSEFVADVNPKPVFSWHDVRREIDDYYVGWEEGEPVDEGVIDADEVAGMNAPADEEYDDINDAMVIGFYGDVGGDRLIGEVKTVLSEFYEDAVNSVGCPGSCSTVVAARMWAGGSCDGGEGASQGDRGQPEGVDGSD